MNKADRSERACEIRQLVDKPDPRAKAGLRSSEQIHDSTANCKG